MVENCAHVWRQTVGWCWEIVKQQNQQSKKYYFIYHCYHYYFITRHNSSNYKFTWIMIINSICLGGVSNRKSKQICTHTSNIYIICYIIYLSRYNKETVMNEIQCLRTLVDQWYMTSHEIENWGAHQDVNRFHQSCEYIYFYMQNAQTDLTASTYNINVYTTLP